MAFRLCEDKKCRSRHPKAVFQVDGRLKCFACYERFMETNFVDEHKIYRLSNKESDFPETMKQFTARAVSA